MTIFLAFSSQVYGFLSAWPNAVEICFNLSFLPVMIQLIPRTYSSFIIQDYYIRLKVENLIENFFVNAEKDEKNVPVLRYWVKFAEKFIVIFFIFSIFVLEFPAIEITIQSIIARRFMFKFPISIPFATDGKIGFFLNMILVQYTVFSLHMVFICYDITIFAYMIAGKGMADVFCLNLQHFKRSLTDISEKIESEILFLTWENQPSTSTASRNYSNEKLVGINSRRELLKTILEFEKYSEFIDSLLLFFAFPKFFEVSSDTIGICLMAIVAYTTGILSCFSGFIYIFQLVCTCTIGSMMLTNNEKILQELLDFPWWLMDKSSQKLFLQFIHKCQNRNQFVLPIIGLIDYKLLVDVINGAYSYFMFIWNFL
jgi:hypothetical protein